MPPLTPQQEARLEAQVFPLERAAYDREQNGEREESFSLKREALARMEAIVGPTSESLADSFISLAVDLRDNGRYEEAESLFLRALSIYETLYGPVHLNAAEALYWLGCLYDDWERYDLSVPVWCRALAIEETVCGKGSPEAANTCTWLGDAHMELRQYAQAEPYFRRAVLIWQVRQAVEGTTRLILDEERLARALFCLKRYADALAAYQNVLALNNNAFMDRKSRRRYNRCKVKCLFATQ